MSNEPLFDSPDEIVIEITKGRFAHYWEVIDGIMIANQGMAFTERAARRRANRAAAKAHRENQRFHQPGIRYEWKP